MTSIVIFLASVGASAIAQPSSNETGCDRISRLYCESERLFNEATRPAELEDLRAIGENPGRFSCKINRYREAEELTIYFRVLPAIIREGDKTADPLSFSATTTAAEVIMWSGNPADFTPFIKKIPVSRGAELTQSDDSLTQKLYDQKNPDAKYVLRFRESNDRTQVYFVLIPPAGATYRGICWTL